MSAPIILAAFIAAGTSTMPPPGQLWQACENGDAKARVEACTSIAETEDYELRARISAFLARGDANSELGENSRALADFGHALGLNPDSSYAHRRRGQILSSEGRMEEATREFDLAVDLNALSPFNFLARAEHRRASGNLAGGRQDLSDAMEIDPGLPELYALRGQIALEMGDAEQASLDLAKVVELQPENAPAYLDLALSYEQLGKGPEALRAADTFLANAGPDAQALALKARVETGAGALDDASRHIAEALALAPDDPGILFDKAAVHSARGEWVETVIALDAAAGAFSETPAFFFQRGYAHYRLGHEDKAILDADRSLALSPDDAGAHWLKAASLFYKGKPMAALDSLASLSTPPADDQIPLLKARILSHLGRPGEALAEYDVALSIQPTDREALLERAEVLVKLKRYREAVSAFDQVLAVDPAVAAAVSGRETALEALHRAEAGASPKSFGPAARLHSGHRPL